MAERRPYKNLSHKELEQELSRQLPRKEKAKVNYVDATAFGEVNKTFLVGTTSTSNNIYYAPTTTGTINELTFTPGGQVYVSDPLSKPTEGAAKPESDMSWLHRRIAEVLWEPA